MTKCIKCGSHAFNLYAEEINQGGLCDVHYWQGRAHRAEAQQEQEPDMLTVGYWVLYPQSTPYTQFAMYQRPTDEQIKNTEQLLGWGWRDA